MADYWESPHGTPVDLRGVDEGKLAALYAAEADPGDVALGLFTEAYEAANLRTRHAWRCGYKNPRTTTPEESTNG